MLNALVLLNLGLLNAQNNNLTIVEDISVDFDVCTYYPAEVPLKSYVKVRESVLEKRAQSLPNCSTINVTYNGFTPQAQTAFQFAVDIWEDLLTSSVPITVNADFGPLDPGVLGGAGPAGFVGLTSDPMNVTPDNTEFYARALAEALLGEESSGNGTVTNDINATFSSSANFYFGTDGNTPTGQIDFVSVVLHELGHGLGILGFGSVDNDDAPTQGEIRANGFPSIWDRFIENGTGVSILDFTDPSAALLAEFQSNDLFCNSASATFNNGGTQPAIYAPGSWSSGSSYSHWDEATFPTGTAQALMTPFLANGEAIHDPGDAMLGFMQDMGWVICDNRLSTDEILTTDFKISPNPFLDRINILLDSKMANDTFDASIIDITGKTIFNVIPENQGGQLVIDQLDELPASLYFLKLTNSTSGQSITKKIIKQ